MRERIMNIIYRIIKEIIGLFADRKSREGGESFIPHAQFIVIVRD